MSIKRRFTINFIITLTEINCKCVSIYKIIKNLSNFKIESSPRNLDEVSNFHPKL